MKKPSKVSLRRLKARCKAAMSDNKKWMEFSVSPEAVLWLLEQVSKG